MKTEQMAEQALKEILERTLSGVDAATQFSKEQIPDVIEQLLLWSMVESILWCIPAILMFIAVVLFNYCMWSKKVGWAYENGKVWDGAIGCNLMISSTGIVISFIMMSLEWLQIIVAPKLYLLEYAAELVK